MLQTESRQCHPMHPKVTRNLLSLIKLPKIDTGNNFIHRIRTDRKSYERHSTDTQQTQNATIYMKKLNADNDSSTNNQS